ncbi:hypothetical protein IG631_23417 [Alternaria alternata]|nr:hypothetical protein IG631_23417 [Alternaria alternata]
MEEFSPKLSASGWDLGAIRPHPTTGFSGTNDSHQVLPLSVRYLHIMIIDCEDTMRSDQ